MTTTNKLSSLRTALTGVVLAISLAWASPSTRAGDDHRDDASSAEPAHAEEADATGEAHDEHGHAEEGDDHAEAAPTEWTPDQIARSGIVVATAGPGRLSITRALSGQILLNADRMAHVASRVDGIITRVDVGMGQLVRTGQVLAAIESREYEDLRAELLASGSRLSLAQVTYRREAELWKQRISAEQDYLVAKQALAEADIAHRQARQKLRAIGLSGAELDTIATDAGRSSPSIDIAAPIDGLIIEKHATIGEVAHTEESLFTVADMSTVWVDLSVFARDLPLIAPGQKVSLSITGTNLQAQATIAYVQPLANVETRAVLARVVLPNPDGRFRPGSFVTANVEIEQLDIPVLIDRDALQSIDGAQKVFLQTEHGFEARTVVTGRQDDESAEITSGLAAGDRYVTTGAFVIKADLEKAGAAHEH